MACDNMGLGELLKAKEVAQLLNLSERKIYNMIFAGVFHCVREGRTIRVWDWSVKDFLRRKTKIFCHENGISLHDVHDLPAGFDSEDDSE